MKQHSNDDQRSDGDRAEGLSGSRKGAGCLVLTLALTVLLVWEARSGYRQGNPGWGSIAIAAALILIIGIPISALLGLDIQGIGRRLGISSGDVPPDQSWAVHREWASGRIRCRSKPGALMLVLAAVLWNALVWPVLYLTWDQAVADAAAGRWGAWVTWILGAIGVLLVFPAVKRFLAWRWFGTNTFVMTSVPGVIGGKLEGVVYTRLGRTPRSVILTLESSRVERSRVTAGFGRERRTNRTSTNSRLWSARQDVDPHRLHHGPEGLAIPVEFRIPAECEPVDPSDPNDSVAWTLKLKVDVPGFDLQTTWWVPVFRAAVEEPA